MSRNKHQGAFVVSCQGCGRRLLVRPRHRGVADVPLFHPVCERRYFATLTQELADEAADA
jgi:DNA-directed RNA polymerase subunit RPC12/RpoP